MINLSFKYKSKFSFLSDKNRQTKIKMKLSTLLAATVSAANIDRRVDIDVKTGEVTEYRSESGMFYFSLLLIHQ